MSRKNDKSLHWVLVVAIGSSRTSVQKRIGELFSLHGAAMWSWTLQEIEIHVLEIQSLQIYLQSLDLHKNQQVIYV
jgi:hypothetical protein